MINVLKTLMAVIKIKNPSQELDFKMISAAETYAVRHPILRAGKPLESCVFEGDDLSTTMHLGLFFNKKLIGVCTFLQKNNALISEVNQYQLRGMAILKDFQGLGFGNSILKHGELMLKKKHIKIVWCNARQVALNFYKKNHYKIIGQPFTIKGIGEHVIMYKEL